MTPRSYAIASPLPPVLSLAGRRLPTYSVCVATGIAIGAGAALALAAGRGLSIPATAAALAAALLTCLVFVLATWALPRRAGFSIYHVQLVTLAGALSASIAFTRSPIAYLDAICVALALCQTLGRVGCLAAGCCHGRPSRLGIRYSDEHAGACDLLGVTLAPVQAIESLWSLVLSALTAAQVWSGAPAGSAFVTFCVGYALGRFLIEFARGDARRRYWREFSEAQLTALGVVAVIAAAQAGDVLPVNTYEAVSGGAVPFVLLTTIAMRRRRPAPIHALFHPVHILEITYAAVVAPALADETAAVRKAIGLPDASTESTSRGIRISGQRSGSTWRYTFSRENGLLALEGAQALADLIVKLHGSVDVCELTAGAGAFHFTVCAREQTRCRLSARVEVAPSGTSLLNVS